MSMAGGTSRRWVQGLVFLFLGVMLVLNLGPIVWGLASSFTPTLDIVSYPPRLVPSALTLEHYETAFNNGFLRPLRTSVVYAGVTVAVALLLGSLGAYALDRIAFRGRGLVMFLVLSGIPLASGAAALIVPTYVYMTWLHLNNTAVVLPLVYIAYNLPIVIWILRGAIGGLPAELDESAMVDGAGRLRILFQILLPICKPAIGAAALFAFVGAWNEFVAGSVLVDSPGLRPIQVAIYQNIGFFGRDWGPLLASASLAILPVVLAFLVFGRLLISGLSSGSVKG